MALKPTLETLEGLDESIASHYVADENGGFKLDIDGKIPAPELKNALEQERENNKKLKAELAKAREEELAREQTRLKEKEDYKTLWEQQKAHNEKLISQQKEREKSFFIDKTVGNLTKDPAKAKVLKQSLLVDVDLGPEGEFVTNVTGVLANQIEDYYRQNYPFLVDGSQASGGGAVGSRGDGGSGDKVLTQKEFDALDPAAKMKYMRGVGRTKQE